MGIGEKLDWTECFPPPKVYSNRQVGASGEPQIVIGPDDDRGAKGSVEKRGTISNGDVGNRQQRSIENRKSGDGNAPIDKDDVPRWVAVPAPPPVNSGSGWHYTSLAGLYGMLNSGTIWATAVDQLNDRMEIQHGLGVFDRAMEDVDKCDMHELQRKYLRAVRTRMVELLTEAPVMAFCLSREGDLLSQWRAYGGSGSGVAISFSVAEIPHQVVDYSHAPDPSAGAETAVIGQIRHQWVSVIYDSSAQERLARETIGLFAYHAPVSPEGYEERLDEDASLALTNIAAMKHSGFDEEREIRLVCSPSRRYPISFRMSDSIPVAYIPMAYFDRPRRKNEPQLSTSEIRGKLRINAIRFGPGSTGLTKLSVNRLMHSHGFGQFDKLDSEVPYR